MKSVILQREPFGEYNTKGKFFVYGDHELVYECDTLELAWRDNHPNISCIPAGIYTITPYISPKLGKCFIVTHVDGRTYILVHVGNYACSDPSVSRTDIEGCILVGNGYADLDRNGIDEIINSREAMNILLNLITLPTKLEIRNAKNV